MKGKTMDSSATYASLVGEKLFIRTVTYHLVGEVDEVIGSFVKLKNASWVACSSEHFGTMITTGDFDGYSEVEYVGEAYANLDATTDMFPWKHDLPTSTK
jgi:hypothetical protein